MNGRGLFGMRLAVAVAVACGVGMLAFAIGQEIPVGSLAGRVVAQESGNAIKGADITLTSVTKINSKIWYSNTEADENGAFDFKRVPAGSYTLEIRSEAHSMKPVRVKIEEGKTQTIEADLTPVDPFLNPYVHQNVFTPDETPQFICRGFVDADALDVRVYRVDVDSFLLKHDGDLRSTIGVRTDFNDEDAQSEANLTKNSSLTIFNSFLAPITKRDAEGVFTQRIDLKGLGPGLYVAAVKAGGVQRLAWVMVTSLGLVTKTAGSETLAYTVDLKTGTPVQGTDVKIYLGSNPIASGRSDGNGLVILKLPTKTEGESQQTVVARDEGSVAFVNAEFTSTPGSDKIVYAYTDRPVYKPDQTVFYKGIVRQQAGDQYKVPGGQQVTVEVRDLNDSLIYHATKHTDKFGCYFGSLHLNPECVTGYYTIVTSINGEKTGDTLIDDEFGDGSNQDRAMFQVAAYRKPEFNVKAEFDKNRYTHGETMHAKVSVNYYFGAPVANAEVSYVIRRNTYWVFDNDDEASYSGYEDYGGYGEAIDQGTLRTDSNGEAVVSYPAAWPEQVSNYDYENDQEFSIDFTVTDRGDQTATGTASTVATRGEFAVEVQPDQFVVGPGSNLHADIVAKDFEKHPVKNQDMTIRLVREMWSDDGTNDEETLYEKDVTTDDRGCASIQAPVKRTGDLRLIAKTRDSRGNDIVSSTYIWSYKEGVDDEGGNPNYSDLQIVTDKKTYSPGETAKVLVITKKPGATALVTVEGDRIYDRRTVRLTGKMTMVELSVKADYRPNFYIGTCFVKNKAFSEQTARAKVTLRERALSVSIKPNKSRYKPGETANYRVRVTDSMGKPVSAEVSLGVVDEAIYAIAPDDTTPILDYFYSRKPNRVLTNFSFPQIYLSDPDKAGAPLKDAPMKIRVRKRFLDTAFWSPNVITGNDGEATLTCKLPDNLTTWRATARAISLDTSCGEARNTVLAQQDMLVRLELPRFLVQGDDSVLTAMVHNYTGRDQRVKVRMHAPGLRIDDRLEQSVYVRNGGSERVDWRVGGSKLGVYQVIVRAEGETAGDAVQLDLPVNPHGEEKRNMQAGVVARALQRRFTVRVRDDVIPEASRLKLRLAPSLASTLLGSVQYLAQYPYGCTEQTTSSFLPDVILSQSMKSLGFGNPKLNAELPDMVSKGLSRLYRFQLEDGGWSWCEYGSADPWMTAYVCYALIRAKNAGFAVNTDVLNNGIQKLGELVKAKRMDAYIRAFGYYVLAMVGQDIGNNYDKIAQMHRLGSETLAVLTLGYAQSGKNDEAKIALKRLFDQAITDSSGTYWTSAEGEYYDGGDVEATALGLQAVMKVNSQDPRVYEIVRWLMNKRRGDYWYSTRDTAMVLYAMSEFLKMSKELNPDCDVAVRVNGKTVKTVHFDKSSIYEPEIEITVPGRELHPGINEIRIVKNGEGTIYYTSDLLQYASKQSMPTTVTGAGLSLTREYYKPSAKYFDTDSERDLGSAVDRAAVGDIVMVRLVIRAHNRLHHLLLEDYIPAGCEIVDRGDVTSWEWDYWWVGQDIRDEKISFYIDELPPGKNVVEYQMRAGFSGTYSALPAQVFSMYEQGVRATSGESGFRIR